MTALTSFRPPPLPPVYKNLAAEVEKDGPNVLRVALGLYGLQEIVGPKHSPVILEMAKDLGGQVGGFYNADEIPWCGLFVAYVLKKAGFEPPKDFAQIRAREYAKWGNPSGRPSRGDVLSFWRGSPSGSDGHVGFYIQEDKHAYYVLGGNQGNAVSIAPIAKNRLIAARRCPWKIAQPAGVKPVLVGPTGERLSENEA